jgi:hypothetical protein
MNIEQGSLHASSTRAREIDNFRPGFEPKTLCTAGEHSSKELSNQLINNYSERLHETSTTAFILIKTRQLKQEKRHFRDNTVFAG